MTRIIKALINFAKKADGILATVCKAILTAMTGNPNFVTPTPTLSAIETALDNFNSALAAAATRDRSAVALKNQYRKELIDLMRQLGNYVNTICMGDVTKLATSGFALSKLPEPRYITAPEKLVVSQGKKVGSLLAEVEVVKGADSYLFEIAPDPVGPGTNWLGYPCSRAKFQFEELEQGKKYWVRVAAVGSNGQVLYSSEVYQYVMQRSVDALTA